MLDPCNQRTLSTFQHEEPWNHLWLWSRADFPVILELSKVCHGTRIFLFVPRPRTRSAYTISALVLDGKGLDYRDGDAIMMIAALVHGPRGYFSRHPVKSYTGASDYDINRSRLHCRRLIADNGIVDQCVRYHCARWDLTLSRLTEHLEGVFEVKFGIVVVGSEIVIISFLSIYRIFAIGVEIRLDRNRKLRTKFLYLYGFNDGRICLVGKMKKFLEFCIWSY